MAKVINIRDAPLDWQRRSEYVYIGRAGKGQDGYFGNPYLLKPEKDRLATLAAFSIYFYGRLQLDSLFKARVLLLKDKTLVCFCKPKVCHGDVIVEYLNEQ